MTWPPDLLKPPAGSRHGIYAVGGSCMIICIVSARSLRTEDVALLSFYFLLLSSPFSRSPLNAKSANDTLIAEIDSSIWHTNRKNARLNSSATRPVCKIVLRRTCERSDIIPSLQTFIGWRMVLEECSSPSCDVRDALQLRSLRVTNGFRHYELHRFKPFSLLSLRVLRFLTND